MEEGENQVAKRIKLMNEDCISVLPDCLLVEILSRLRYTKSAIKTGALSKRWKHLWTFVPSLYFINDGVIHDFVSLVDKTLSQRPQFKLKKFLVYNIYKAQYESQVKSWIHYAISCNVEQLSLTLWNQKLYAQFMLDQSFFMCSCFTDLTLEDCMFNPVGAISWKNLRRLSISHGNLNEDLMENILFGSPQLETLVLTYCYGYTRLSITSKSVKNLVISGYIDPNDDYDSSIIEINAPNILSLAIRGKLVLGKLLLVNVSSLVKANLNYFTNVEQTPEEAQAEEEMLRGFMLNLRHVKDLHIWSSCSRVMSRLEAKCYIFPSNMKFSDVNYEYSDSDYVESEDW